MSTKITELKAVEILDSRGNPTLKVKALLANGSFGFASVPSGASTGVFEAVELRDGDESRYGGKGVTKAVEHVNSILNDELRGFDAENQEALDTKMIEIDGTENKGRLGANAILGVSLAAAKAIAWSHNMQLYEYIKKLTGNDSFSFPRPMMNIINGGKHADSGLDIQEFMIMPKKQEMSEMVRIGAEVFHTLKKVLQEKGESTGVGDEGGFAPKLSENKEALELIMTAIEKAGYTPGEDITIALDSAAASFYNKNENIYEMSSGKRSTEELLDYYSELTESFPIISIEDPFDENDWDGFIMMTEKYGDTLQIVGDDLFVTNPKILKRGIEEKAANAVLIKLNQIGTLTETIQTINLAKEADFKTIISHRSGETCDTTIADLAYGSAAGQIKTGSLSRSERISKYNRLLEIQYRF
ncbi:phosphopyruvate hydratase [Patescibacteria group bacterium]|nr:phosphopyruvate hydratase [Patescibacteria group bacterium]